MLRLNSASDIPKHWHVKDVIHVGVNVQVDESVEIGLPEFPVETLYVGDHVTLHGPSRFIPRKLVIGNFSKIYDGFWCGGDRSRNGDNEHGGEAYFGHNAWLAPRCIADPTGGVYIGNGFGAGHETHIWSHCRHGDVLAGCRYLSYGRFVAEDDVWLVGRCTANPVWCEPFSVAMTSAQIVKDMKRNRVYAGNPAVDITDKTGPPYMDRRLDERWKMFEQRLQRFQRKTGAPNADIAHLAGKFDLLWRTYHKENDALEVQFMRSLLPECKFIPHGQHRIDGGIAWPKRNGR